MQQVSPIVAESMVASLLDVALATSKTFLDKEDLSLATADTAGAFSAALSDALKAAGMADRVSVLSSRVYHNADSCEIGTSFVLTRNGRDRLFVVKLDCNGLHVEVA